MDCIALAVGLGCGVLFGFVLAGIFLADDATAMRRSAVNRGYARWVITDKGRGKAIFVWNDREEPETKGTP
jgi:hypothetical protein